MTNQLDGGTVTELQDRVACEVLVPGAAGYDPARLLWNGRFQPRPAVVVRPRTAEEVAAVVNFVRERGLPLSVRSGGHSYAGHSVQDGAVALDLSAMDTVRVDAERRTVEAGPGATWGDVDGATQAFGLATPGPTVSTVGVAGFVLGGGSGYLTRRHGMAVDNLVAAEIVTADGRIRRVDEGTEADLFWAIRGGSGNFGVVTSFVLRLHPVGPEVATAQAWHRFEDAAAAFRLYRDYMESAPDEVNMYAFVLRVPPVQPFPEDLHGQPAVALVGLHSGDPAAGMAALKAVTDAGEPFFSSVATMPYAAMQQAFDAGMPKGLRWYTRAHNLRHLSDDVIDIVIRHTRELPGPFTMAYLGAGGGAVGRVAPDATAYPHRDAPFDIHIFPGWSDPADDDAIMQWARQFHDALSGHAVGGAYVNLMGEDQTATSSGAYGGNLERLRQLKAQWDPDNLFRSNHNIVADGG
ncbi:MAG TPA: FAD-binding oxidoreductase [Longimicrobiales bacterium]|nr:FAD-binding oxidoreductase [Longimicrobiales bacterium]